MLLEHNQLTYSATVHSFPAVVRVIDRVVDQDGRGVRQDHAGLVWVSVLVRGPLRKPALPRAGECDREDPLPKALIVFMLG